ncbi:hypothetical protein CIK05_08610 [Bdellovibrio sp. qaytius]|nr:hypothetical protein CIK05_08610 [Bdellovibrio sp. qaytius]
MKYILASLFLFSTAYAGVNDDIYAYNYWGREIIKDYAAEIYASPFNVLPDASDTNKCMPVYNNAIKNGVMDIRYALGYFDDSQGIDIIWNGKNWGLSPSIEIGMFNSIRGKLSEPCKKREQLNLCGFTESGDPSLGKVLLQKRITLLKNSVLVKIELTQASASESFVANQSSLKERQAFLTAQSEESYFGGIGKADIVIYNGHSRNGGGPDFNPPVLNKDLHVDYSGYYQKKRIGISRVLKLIKASDKKDGILTFFSCYSKKHFYNDIMLANPKQKLVLSADTINYFDSLKASMGYLEGFLRGACGQDLADIAKQGEHIKSGFLGSQIQ